MEVRSSTPRSSSRSKRSSTNLSHLRLAPLSTKFAETPVDRTILRSPYDDATDAAFARQHPSYIQGRSAPTTPGILSRSSSRRQLHGGLVRRVYDVDDVTGGYSYEAVKEDTTGGLRVDVGSGQIPKAKSEAALSGAQQRLSGHGVPLQKKRHHGRSQTGTHTPRVIPRKQHLKDDWFTHARATTNALVQESKGQSWLASRDSSTTLNPPDTDDDVDDNYEELAAMSVSHHSSRLQFADDELSPVGSRKGGAWGSRYGSRSVSRRTSRRGSFVAGSRTPLAGQAGQDAKVGYFDDESESFSMSVEPDFVNAEDSVEGEESELSRLTQDRSFGLGGIVDRLMGFNLFKVEEHEEASENEEDPEAETEGEAKERRAAENKRKREEKQKLTLPPPAPSDDEAAQGNVGWQDATWLLSVATKAIF